jgi:hypothetical protein
LVGVEVDGAQCECAAAAAGGFDVQAEDQCVEGGIVAGRGCRLDDLGEAGVGDGASGGGWSARFVDLIGGVWRRR